MASYELNDEILYRSHDQKLKFDFMLNLSPLCQAETNHDAKLILVRAQNLPGQVHVM
jgi:hypothetical protein